MKNKKPLSKKAKILIGILSAAVLIALCCFIVNSYAKNSASEGTYETENASYLNVPEDYEGFKALLNKNTAESKKEHACAVKLESRIEIHDDSIKTDKGENTDAVLKFIKKNTEENINGKCEGFAGTFAEFKGTSPEIVLSENGVSSFEKTFGETDGKENGECTYDIAFENPDISSGEYKSVFEIQKTLDALSVIEKEYASVLEIPDRDIILNKCEIHSVINRQTLRVQNTEFRSEYTFSYRVKFIGELSKLGEAEITFDCAVIRNYSFSFAGIAFDEKEIFIKAGSDEQLPLTVTVDENAEKDDYSVKFISSDESVLSVNGDAVISGLKESPKEVTVKAELTYLGNTYTDECTVFVTVPVKKIMLESKTLTLKENESQTLGALISPENATVKDIMWISEDEEIAAVSSDGTVKAKKQGETKINAVSRDGHFKSTCFVNVVKEAE